MANSDSSSAEIVIKFLQNAIIFLNSHSPTEKLNLKGWVSESGYVKARVNKRSHHPHLHHILTRPITKFDSQLEWVMTSR
jgi:hypothetical protein